MTTDSEILSKKMTLKGFYSRVLADTESESVRLNDIVNSIFFNGRSSLSVLLRSRNWNSLTEQRDCLLDLLGDISFNHHSSQNLIFFIPLFGPDQTIETTSQEILHCLDDFLEFEWFLILNQSEDAAICQERFGEMELLVAKHLTAEGA